MNDKELLELAAKAAGWVYLTNGQTYIEGMGNVGWNPLTDDGDALRLVVKLGLTMDSYLGNEGPKETYVWANNCHIEHHNNDPYAATRRAIVRAAAEIGRGMK